MGNINFKPDTDKMYDWATDLFPICRSLTGKGVRDTLEYLKNLIPEMNIFSVPSGTKAFDWTVPDEWNIDDAYIEDESGNKVINFKDNNLHVVGYSEPIDANFTLSELKDHLYTLPDQPDAIPYVTSYYSRRWGFCLSHNQLQGLKDGTYRAVIKSDIRPGVLNYGEVIIPGIQKEEILLSTYVCHPSMANNELSGPVVTTALARWIKSISDRRYTYRIIFIPETIGSILYLSKHLEQMRRYTIAGFVITCIGDDRTYSFMPSRTGDTLADRIAKHVLAAQGPFDEYSFLQRGSDERQYCSPMADLPVASIMRSKYGTYPEYHTSLDDLSLISQSGLAGGYRVLRDCLAILERNWTYQAVVPCEPQLGKRGLYPTLSTKSSAAQVRTMMNILAYADGQRDLVSIAETIGADFKEAADIAERLYSADLLKRINNEQKD